MVPLGAFKDAKELANDRRRTVEVPEIGRLLFGVGGNKVGVGKCGANLIADRVLKVAVLSKTGIFDDMSSFETFFLTESAKAIGRSQEVSEL